MRTGIDLECLDDGARWQYVTNWGNVFSTLHIVVIALQAILCERMFYSIPHKMNLLKIQAEIDHLKAEELLTKDGPTPNPTV